MGCLWEIWEVEGKHLTFIEWSFEITIFEYQEMAGLLDVPVGGPPLRKRPAAAKAKP